MEYARQHARQRVSTAVPSRIVFRVLQHVCLIAGPLALGYVGFVILEAHTYQAKKIQEIEQPREIEQSPSTTPGPPPIGAAIAEIEIPRVGLHAAVVQGDSDKILQLAVGHMPQTALPGESGNMVFAGHRSEVFGRAIESWSLPRVAPTTTKSNRRRSWRPPICLCCAASTGAEN